jgi:hypothetical protein
MIKKGISEPVVPDFLVMPGVAKNLLPEDIDVSLRLT